MGVIILLACYDTAVYKWSRLRLSTFLRAMVCMTSLPPPFFFATTKGRLELSVLRHVPRRGQRGSVPTGARGGPGAERQEGHEGDRLGGAHGVRRDLRAVRAIRVAASVGRSGTVVALLNTSIVHSSSSGGD